MMKRRVPRKIKVAPLKGMKLSIEETEKAGVFVFKDSQGRRLYAKLCEKADLLRGWIWEILTPEEMQFKAISIEETYNEKIYQDLYISENVTETQIRRIEDCFKDD